MIQYPGRGVLVPTPNLGGVRIFQPTVSGIAYLLRDEFITDRAAGSVDGTAAEPGPGTRTVVDSGNLVSITGGVLRIAGGGLAADPHLVYGTFSRTAGRVLLGAIYAADFVTNIRLGFDDSTPSTIRFATLEFVGGAMEALDGAASPVVGSKPTGSEWFYAAIVLRSSGLYLFGKNTSEYSNWTLLWGGTVDSTETLIPGVASKNDVDYDNIRIPDVLWLPTPVTYDSFTRANGPLGTSETTGPDGQDVTGRTWNNRVGTTLVSSNTASANALDGGIAIATVNCGKTDVLHGAELTRSAGNVGIVLRYADTSNYIYAIHDGTNAKLIKRVADGETTVITAVTAYAAGAVICVICEGTSFALYYNNAKIGSTSTVSDAALQTGTEVGLYSSDTGNSQDDMVTFPRGTGGEYSDLDSY